jgi:hypothetical protein
MILFHFDAILQYLILFLLYLDHLKTNSQSSHIKVLFQKFQTLSSYEYFVPVFKFSKSNFHLYLFCYDHITDESILTDEDIVTKD